MVLKKLQERPSQVIFKNSVGIRLLIITFLDDLVCQFGDKLVKKGQSFEKTNITSLFGVTFEKVECECDVPPLVKCISVSTKYHVQLVLAKIVFSNLDIKKS